MAPGYQLRRGGSRRAHPLRRMPSQPRSPSRRPSGRDLLPPTAEPALSGNPYLLLVHMSLRRHACRRSGGFAARVDRSLSRSRQRPSYGGSCPEGHFGRSFCPRPRSNPPTNGSGRCPEAAVCVCAGRARSREGAARGGLRAARTARAGKRVTNTAPSPAFRIASGVDTPQLSAGSARGSGVHRQDDDLHPPRSSRSLPVHQTASL